MLCITDAALPLIHDLEGKSRSAENVPTLFSSGVGCGTPVIKLEMRSPMEDDIIEEISGFKFHIRPDIKKFIDDAEITAEETFWGKQIKVNTVFGCK